VEGCPVGNELFREVKLLTGLPDDLIGEELTQLLENKGVTPNELTLDSLRLAVEEYLKQIDQEMNLTKPVLVTKSEDNQ
jgi:hypothetical protein